MEKRFSLSSVFCFWGYLHFNVQLEPLILVCTAWRPQNVEITRKLQLSTRRKLFPWRPTVLNFAFPFWGWEAGTQSQRSFVKLANWENRISCNFYWSGSDCAQIVWPARAMTCLQRSSFQTTLHSVISTARHCLRTLRDLWPRIGCDSPSIFSKSRH